MEENTSRNSFPKEPESLLRKFEIPVDHLDFDYVKECKDAKELEHILQILQSGEEGFYPDLQQCTEESLTKIKPNSKLLRKQVRVLTRSDLDKNEWQSLCSDMESWTKEINKNDEELLSFREVKNELQNIPVRESKILKKNQENKQQRLKSMDYEAWDKLNVDAEILKMDLQEEKMKKALEIEEKEKEKQSTVVVRTDYMSSTELSYSAMKEKERGNQCYKTGDYEEALQYYTNSLTFLPTTNVYNNRAITYIKLNQFENALIDCEEVLKTEPSNIKGLLRKSLALKQLQQYDKAYECLQILIQINPNNTVAQNMLVSIADKAKNVNKLRSVRLTIKDEAKIKEYNESTGKKYKNVIVPIPGPSNEKPPYYKVVNMPEDQAKKYENSTKKTLYSSSETVIDLNNKPVTEGSNDKYIKEPEEIKKTRYMRETEKENRYSYNQQDLQASGEPHIYFNLQDMSPYSFMKYWQTVKSDSSLVKLEQVLRGIDPKDLSKVIGDKLDDQMLGMVLKCLEMYFMNTEDITSVVNILTEITKVPRFSIVTMLLNKHEKQAINNLIRFIDSSGHKLTQDVLKMLLV